MKISNIDKDFKDIIYGLDAMGFKPYASCDGVEANHKSPKDVSLAYIAFLKSSRILNLMAELLKDKENFIVVLSTETETKPYELYGNIISGTTYSVYFQNRKGDKTQYFKDIIMKSIKRTEHIQSREDKMLYIVEKILEQNAKSILSFRTEFNTDYQPYMKKSGKINRVAISTKYGNSIQRGDETIYTYKDMEMLARVLSKNLKISNICDSSNEYTDDEFIVNTEDKSECIVYYKDEHFVDVMNQIMCVMRIEHKLPTIEYKDLYMDFENYSAKYITGTSEDDR